MEFQYICIKIKQIENKIQQLQEGLEKSNWVSRSLITQEFNEVEESEESPEKSQPYKYEFKLR